MAVKPYGDGRYLLSYDPQYASPTDINKIEVLYLFGGARVSQTIFFNPAGDAVSVRPKGTLRIEQSGGVIRGTMQLRVSGTAAEVRRIVLFNPADGARIVAERIEPPQLADKVRYHVPCLPEILCADVFKRTFGKISHFFLSVRAVTHNLRRIGDVDLLRKGINGGKLVGGEIGVLLHELIAGFDGFRSCGLLFRRSLCAERVESQSGH